MAGSSIKLYNAARKYCIEQHAHWAAAYRPMSEKHGVNYTSEEYDTFPRYQALSAILNEVEKIDTDNLPPFAELSKLLIEAGNKAPSLFIEKPSNEIMANAIADEKEKFVSYIKSQSESSVSSIDALPYRRVLSEQEVTSLWQKIDNRWGAEGSKYWYPLADKSEPTLFAFDAAVFEKKFSYENLQDILHSWKIERLYELREYGDENYSLSVDLWEPFYGPGGEGFWVSESLDWIMYASHEGTITVGGRLKDKILKLWPDAPEFDWNNQSWSGQINTLPIQPKRPWWKFWG